MYSDFLEFSNGEFKDIKLIGGDYKDKELGRITISTWQSLKSTDVDIVILDEAHKVKADVLNDIIKSDIPYKYGMTGSVPVVEIDYMKLVEAFGKPVQYTTAKSLIQNNILTKTTIISMFLNHSNVKSKTYQEEIKFISENENRTNYLIYFLKKLPGVSVALFNTTKFGRSLYLKVSGEKRVTQNFDRMKKNGVFFIDGKTKPELREKIRLYLNSKESNQELLIAQYNTLSTGINIPKLKNLVFAQPIGKSYTLILQSIGRVMRNSKEKGDNVYVWDLVDVLDYSLNHFWERLEYYNSEGHPVIEKEIELKNF
jgi:superfamily II DNA or RNA helicase